MFFHVACGRWEGADPGCTRSSMWGSQPLSSLAGAGGTYCCKSQTSLLGPRLVSEVGREWGSRENRRPDVESGWSCRGVLGYSGSSRRGTFTHSFSSYGLSAPAWSGEVGSSHEAEDWARGKPGAKHVWIILLVTMVWRKGTFSKKKPSMVV